MLPHLTGGGVNFQAAIGPVTSHFRALCASENYTKADPRLINKEAHGGSPPAPDWGWGQFPGGYRSSHQPLSRPVCSDAL